MPPTSARIIGGPGAGKTTRLLDIIDRVTQSMGISPMQLGFVSFTRAARREAATRAGSKFGIPPSDLEKSGWFRTLHSIAYRQMSIAAGELIVGGEEDTEWLRNALDDPSIQVSRRDDNDDGMPIPSDRSEAGKAMAIWDAARNRLEPLAVVWKEIADSSINVPNLFDCEETVRLYEAAKAKEGRIDFTDLLMQFAGKRWTGKPTEGFEDCTPRGEPPYLPVWIGDEWQDTSLLASLVFHRLIADSRWVYIGGDSNQALYNWAGADGSIFSEWPGIVKEDFLPISYRCKKAVLDLGKRIIQDPRLKDFHPAGDGGSVSRADLLDCLQKSSSASPTNDFLIIARTNDYTRRIGELLDDIGLPWRPVKGGPGSTSPAKVEGIAALLTLRKGGGINGDQMHRVMDLIPSTKDGTRFFEVGAKKHYEDKTIRASSHQIIPLTLKDIGDAGCTEAFQGLVASGGYTALLEKPAAKLAAAADRHGIEAVRNPSIRVGTCHAVKGMEAENVILLNQIPYPTYHAIQTQKGLLEERRVWFVSTTRAKTNLYIAEGSGEVFPEV